MQTFSQFPYTRPDIDQLKVDFEKALQAFKQAPDAQHQMDALEAIYELREEFSAASDLARVRHTQDTTDEFYKAENTFFDESSPIYEGLISDFYRSLLSSPFAAELKEQFGDQLFTIAELTIKTFIPEITADLQQENKLASEYVQLLASARIPFNGEELNLSELNAFQSSHDRDVRKAAHTARWEFMASKADELDRIFEELVQVRHRIATKLGFENFVELGYARMLRSEYNASHVAGFREAIRQNVVPLATELKKEQAARLGLPDLKYYDESLIFPDGNAKPKGDAEWIIEQGQEMYDQLSSSTGDWYRYMVEGGLMDLVARKGKAGGGYCTYIGKHEAPFIFANFNGTDGDVFVLTHEAGHAFQCYSSRKQQVSEYFWPTYEACEIHSMSMEYFTWPYMELFFKEEAEKYRYGHLTSSLLFLAYGSAVDEFQHFVYEHPDCGPEARNRAWREIEKKYLPTRDYAGNEHLEKGGFWQIQRHIYQMPFYYIDYVLAQICAFQFLIKSNKDRSEAFEHYVALCGEGGSKPFLELVQFAGLESPFQSSTIEAVVKYIEKFLEKTETDILV